MVTRGPKNFKLMLSDGAFPELYPGDCLMVTELQRPGHGEAPYVALETHAAYPFGLDEGPFNDAVRGSPSDLHRAMDLQLSSKADEEFAQFVFAHFGGYWMSNRRPNLPSEEEVMRKLPKRIADRVTEMAREYELKRGGP